MDEKTLEKRIYLSAKIIKTIIISTGILYFIYNHGEEYRNTTQKLNDYESKNGEIATIEIARDLRNSSFILPSGNAVAAEAYLDRKKADYVNPEIYEIMKDK